MGFLDTDDEFPLDLLIARSRDAGLYYKGEHPITSLLSIVVALGIPLALVVGFVVGLLTT